MERIWLMILGNFFRLPVYGYKLFFWATNKKKTEADKYGFIHNAVRNANKAGRVKVDVYGKENLPKENGYIMFPNHQGLFDTLTMLECNEQPFGVIMKIETDKNIFCRKFRQMLGGQLMDRDDIRQSMKVINQMAEEVKQGRNYVIFAEGTRSKNGNNIQEFKGGTFKSATKAKCPIVPVAIIDTYKAFDIHSIAPITVQLHFLKPLLYEDYKDMKTTEIAKIVSDMIRETIEKYEVKEDKTES